MEGSTVFRTSTPVAAPEFTSTAPVDKSSHAVSNVQVPYLDYRKSSGQPFSVDYFNLGDTWQEPVGGFSKEVGIIEDYFSDKISSGDMPNSVTAVKDRLKEILKITNMSKEERNLIKVETIAAYIKFLRESDDIRQSVKRYGSA
jgi:hypothetical protein